MYYALTLSKETQNALWRVFNTFFDLSEDWEKKMDHITLIHSSNEHWTTVSKILQNFEGHTLNFHIVGVGFGEGVVAFRVSTETANAVSHITIAVAPHHSPKESNDIQEWERLYCDTEFSGRVALCK